MNLIASRSGIAVLALVCAALLLSASTSSPAGR